MDRDSTAYCENNSDRVTVTYTVYNTSSDYEKHAQEDPALWDQREEKKNFKRECLERNRVLSKSSRLPKYGPKPPVPRLKMNKKGRR